MDKTYYVNGDNDRTYFSHSARKVAHVAKAWSNCKINPKLYCVFEVINKTSGEGVVTCQPVLMGKTIKETERNLIRSKNG